MFLGYPVRLIQSLVREHKKAKERSPHWSAFRDSVLRTHPECAACGKKRLLQVHHIFPFHLFPARELDPTNVIVLCMTFRCEAHLRIGHGGSFKAYNPLVDAHAKIARDGEPKQAAMFAKAARVIDDDTPMPAPPLPP